jgi:hypothetical protein
LDARWTDFAAPDAEQVVYDPGAVGTARVVEATVTEAAACVGGVHDADGPGGDLVHIPFYEVPVRLGTERATLCVDACSGRPLPDRSLGRPGDKSQNVAGISGAVAVSWAVMFLAAAAIPNGWLAAATVGVLGIVAYWGIGSRCGDRAG